MQAGAPTGISAGVQATSEDKLAAMVSSFSTPKISAQIVLDVGGTVFTTSLATLNSSFAGNSWFAARFSGTYSDPLEGHVFIDRDPVYFHLVLSFLRDGWCILPDGLQELRRLRAEADFYNLAGLLDLIDQSPTMLVFFRDLMVVSPEGDWQDKLPGPQGSRKHVECVALSRVASEAERVAARKYTRDMCSHVDASLALCLRGQKIPEVFRLRVPNEANLEGCYEHLRGVGGNGFPVWKLQGANKFLFSDINGYWAFGMLPLAGDISEISDLAKTDVSLVRSHSLHQGALPSDMEGKWCGARSGGFVLNSGIRVTSEKPRNPDQVAKMLETSSDRHAAQS